MVRNNEFKYDINLVLDATNIYNFDIEINQENEFDESTLKIESGITKDMVFSFDPKRFTGTTISSYSNPILWENKVASAATLYDIGLCGIDNGFSSQLSGETFNITTGSTFTLKRVLGNKFSYPMAADESNSIKSIKLQGGFYQGFYKLHEYPYEVLPNITQKGMTFDFWLKLEDSNNTNILNNAYPENKNIFFFMGTRAEDKFHNSFSGETGLKTTTGEALNNASGSTGYSTCLAFRLTEDNRIGYRKTINRVTSSGDSRVYINEKYSDQPIAGNMIIGKWVNIVTKYERYLPLEPCFYDNTKFIPAPKDLLDCENIKVPNTQRGRLTFYVNGIRVFVVDEFEEVVFKQLLTDKTKQQSVPYNISIGGGTQGLIESKTFLGDDLNDRGLLIENNFAGSFEGYLGEVKLYSRPLSVPEIQNNFLAKKDYYKIMPENGIMKKIALRFANTVNYQYYYYFGETIVNGSTIIYKMSANKNTYKATSGIYHTKTNQNYLADGNGTIYNL